MKNTTTTIIADRNAVNYFCLMNPVQAKKTLLGMTTLSGDQRMSESKIPEVRNIARFYDGVIQADFARNLAKKLAEEYAKINPDVLLTKKKAQEYTEVNHGKLLTALGVHGLDYVLTVLRRGKAYVANPANGIEEKHMLNALRWVERRKDQDEEKSNSYHRKKGLQLIGFGDMAEDLVKYSFIIANLYEQVTPETQGETKTDEMEVTEELKVEKPEIVRDTVHDMKIHFIQQAGLILDFYGTTVPVIPEGYAEDELVEGSIILALANKGLLKDSEQVLNYIEKQKYYQPLIARVNDEFNEAELEALRQHSEFIKELIKSSW